MFWQGNNDYFYLVSVICLLGVLLLVFRLFFPDTKERARRKAERALTKEEKLNYKHLPSRHEAKKGLQRLQFDADGKLDHKLFSKTEVYVGKALIAGGIIMTAAAFVLLIMYVQEWMSSMLKTTNNELMNSIYTCSVIAAFCFAQYLGIGNRYIRDYSDQVFDSVKKIYNKILWKLHKPDQKKMNTLRKWSIDYKDTYWRSGIPVLTSKRMVWVDPTDSHTLIIGTPNSGKTTSVINPLIDFTRMSGECMVVADLKGELNKLHRKALEADGYHVIIVNFIDPEKGEQWNPFGTTIKQYRKAQKENEEKILSTAEGQQIYQKYINLKKARLRQEAKVQAGIAELRTITDKDASQKKAAEIMGLQYKVNEINQSLEHLIEVEAKGKNINIHPDFSEALTLLTDIAYTLCYEAQAKDPFWWQMSQSLIEGGVLFLLEQEYLDDNGNLCQLNDDQINFKNIKMLIMDGKEEVTTDLTVGHKPLLKFYLDNFRLKKTDESVDRLDSFVSAPEDTRGSIMSEFSTKIKIGTLNNNILKMTSKTSFDFNEIGKKKTAVFLVVHDEKSTYYSFLTVFIKQLYEEIVKTSRDEKNLRLPIPVRIIWDEFGISPALSDIDKLLSAGRFRGVLMTMAVQDFSQIDNTYGKMVAKAIKNNVMDLIYLLGGDPDTLKEVSERAGFTMKWNKEKSCYEKVPLIPTDRLSTLSMGEAVVIRQRAMPVITRYYPYSKYIFAKKLMANDQLESRELPEPKTYSINDDYYNLVRYGKNLTHFDKPKTEIDNGQPHVQERRAEQPKVEDKEAQAERRKRIMGDVDKISEKNKEKKKGKSSMSFGKKEEPKEDAREIDRKIQA